MPIRQDSVRRAVGLNPGQLRELALELNEQIKGDVRLDKASRLMYATDASMYQMEPVGVILPRDEQDVAAVIRTASRSGVPVLPRGGGTSLAGGTVNHALVMDFSRYMNRVIQVQPDEQWARVQPGLVVNHLNQAVARYGLHYAPDPVTSSHATIGGGIGTNSCGAHSVIYGKTLDHILGMDVVLSNGSSARFGEISGNQLVRKLNEDSFEGQLYREVRAIAAKHRAEVMRRFPKILRRVSGYNLDEFLPGPTMDLTKMMVGSEGTLGVTTEAKVNLVPTPKHKGVAAVHFNGLVEAMEATVAILGHSPSAVELIGSLILRRCKETIGFRQLMGFVEGEPECLLLVEFYGETEAATASKLDKLRHDLERRGLGYATVATTNPAYQRQMWELRRAGLGLVMSIPGDAKPVPFVEDTAVSPEKLPEYIARFEVIVGRYASETAYYGHASTGCLHIRPMLNIKRKEGLAAMESIAEEVADLVLEFGGSLSGEHGDGIVRGVFTERMFGPELFGAFRELKNVFDPEALMNPGKILDTPKLVENLRVLQNMPEHEPDTVMDFTTEGGFTAAVELCNGQGACRKLEGTMCPSFMVTREEEHSTRGRANMLRMITSGILPPSELTDRRLHQALDLCVECKGCKLECPSGVDMAKLKAEVLTKYHDAHGVALRSKLFGHIALMGRLGSATAPLSNWILKLLPLRWLLHFSLGIHRRRPFPLFAKQSFSDWFRKRTRPEMGDKPRGRVVLFNDTHMEYFQPGVGKAAVLVLAALGFEVITVQGSQCCGRPLISKGMLKGARDWARQNVDALLPYVQAGMPIVGVEPSCILTFRDEYPDLLKDEASRLVASRTFLFDEFVDLVISKDPAVVKIFRDDARVNIRLHGHCHQKALSGMDATVRVLGSIPGYTVELIDAGCCGMAGAFGFEKEHYELSRAMGAHQLFLSLGERTLPDSQVAVTGISCHQQISHFTGHQPRHVVELLADAVK